MSTTVKIHWQARFDLKAPLKTVQLLRKIAAKHYDYECKRAGTTFLRVWEERIEHVSADYTFDASFSMVDTTLKICEMAEAVIGLCDNDSLALVSEYCQAAGAALRAANLRYLQLHEEG